MSEHFVEEHASGAPGKNRRPGVGIDDGRFAQRVEVVDHSVYRRQHRVVAWQRAGIAHGEGFVARQRHAVLGNRAGAEAQSELRPAGAHSRSLAAHEPALFDRALKRRATAVDVLVVGERRGVAPHLRLPCIRIDGIDIQRGDFAQVLDRRFLGEIRRLVLRIDLHFDVRPHFGEVLRGFLVVLIGRVPDHAADRVDVVFDGDQRLRAALPARGFPQRPGTVQHVVANADVHVEVPALAAIAESERAERSRRGNRLRLGDFVAQEIGRRLLLAKHRHRPRQLEFEGFQNRILLRTCGRCENDCDRAKRATALAVCCAVHQGSMRCFFTMSSSKARPSPGVVGGSMKPSANRIGSWKSASCSGPPLYS